MSPPAVTTLQPFIADWAYRQDLIRQVREAVFVAEQGVPLELERDGLDHRCTQVLAMDALQQPVATARMTAGGHIGRMAVVKDYRGKGLGSAMLELLLQQARGQKLRCVFLNAQTRAMEFYRRRGFQTRGEEFLDAGIPHQRMELNLYLSQAADIFSTE